MSSYFVRLAHGLRKNMVNIMIIPLSMGAIRNPLELLITPIIINEGGERMNCVEEILWEEGMKFLGGIEMVNPFKLNHAIKHKNNYVSEFLLQC